MNLKITILTVAGAVFFAAIAFGQSMQIKGKITAVTATEITIESGPNTYTVARTGGTQVSSGGFLKVGAIVTIQCNASDAHKNEQPADAHKNE